MNDTLGYMMNLKVLELVDHRPEARIYYLQNVKSYQGPFP